jgi:hypothetical protein
MRKQVLRLALALAIIGVVLVGVATAATAQTVPTACKNLGRYDMTNDGVLDRYDLIAWKQLYMRSVGEGCDFTKGDTSLCPAALDLDGNGRVEIADAIKHVQLFALCSRPPANTNPGR